MPKSIIASAWATRRGRRTWHARTLFAREPGDLMVGQQHSALCCSGPHWEGEEPKPMVHDYEKSDSAIVARKPTNKVERSAAEPVEPRAEAKGNASQQKHAPGAVPGSRDTSACLHTAPSRRRYPRWEPYAGNPLVRICA